MLSLFFNINHENVQSKNDPLQRLQKLLSPRQVDFLLTHLSKLHQRFFYSVVRFNLLPIECKTTRFSLLHPTQNPNLSSQLCPKNIWQVGVFARQHYFCLYSHYTWSYFKIKTSTSVLKHSRKSLESLVRIGQVCNAWWISKCPSS